MKAALIPPIAHLKEFGHGEFHLLLAHLLTNSKYKKHYKEERKQGAYLVLDNSAHEKGHGQDPATLLRLGCELDAQEIVVPDVLDDAGATIEACLSAHEEWFESGSSEIWDIYSPAFMYVPQGKNRQDWIQCMNDLVQIHTYCARRYSLRRDFVLGISKDYDVWDGGLDALIGECVDPLRESLLRDGVRLQVHMLGWMRDLWNLDKIASRYPWIRSTDSAKPFVYALANVMLTSDTVPKYPKRPSGYFTAKFTRKQMQFAEHNAWLFRQAAA